MGTDFGNWWELVPQCSTSRNRMYSPCVVWEKEIHNGKKKEGIGITI
jgi:hypothetical protein